MFLNAINFNLVELFSFFTALELVYFLFSLIFTSYEFFVEIFFPMTHYILGDQILFLIQEYNLSYRDHVFLCDNLTNS